MSKTTVAELQRQAENIMQRFKFDNVRTAMQALNWGWAGTGGVPSVAELKGTADYLLQNAIAAHNKAEGQMPSHWCWATGGFMVRVLYLDDGAAALHMSFYVDQVQG